MGYSLSPEAELAFKYINNTNRHIFLTGKAGTGKTTLLRHIIQNTFKNTVVAAPTGIAAINAGGVTLHSLLHLPFGAFVPESIPLNNSFVQINTPQTLFRNSRFNASKRKLIQEMELLIIDEVSMLRADLLDCIDHVLRSIRRRRFDPFGGVQILFIGDLLQLPPVIKNEEKAILENYYSSLFFYQAHALKNESPIGIELKIIYRQKDQDFIELLNRLRHNRQTSDDISLLNSYRSDKDSASDGSIFLTTHNRKADEINSSKLEEIKKDDYKYKAVVSGDFPEHLYPADERMVLKEGAQVMFIKNDPSGEGQFFNGKIGEISELDKDYIRVQCEKGDEIEVSPYKWENKRYALNKETNEIEEQLKGSFEQYPLKLAWAVTIHKSQGLTFERATLDLSESFSPGQLYVALSRLTSLKGLELHSGIPENPPKIEESLIEYLEDFQSIELLEGSLDEGRKEFLASFSRRAFSFDPLLRELNNHLKSFDKDENRSLKQRYLSWTKELINDSYPLKETGDRFMQQLNQILAQEDYKSQLQERLSKANDYFQKFLKKLTDKITDHQKELSKQKSTKTYKKELEELLDHYKSYQKLILKLNLLANEGLEDNSLTKETIRTHLDKLIPEKTETQKSKTPTAEISFDLFKEGKTVEEIAEFRGLVYSTVIGHLIKYLETGEIEANQLMEKVKLEKFGKLKLGEFNSLSELKSELKDEFSYIELKIGLAYRKSKAEEV
ncbi:MAG: helix-turn-helix domain-containing protein [Bacteroidota bacterium]